jgi:beta-galactosidase
VKSLGLRLVDTYVPWSVHETGARRYDFGRSSARLDVVRFLSMAAELGLYVIMRPGPHINAELTGFGIPRRVLHTRECQALSARRLPVILPVPPLAFPVPSYASQAFRSEVRTWFSAVGERLAPLCFPSGPIALVQVDNEGAMYFRDGVYDQDYHPDAIRTYRAFLREKYATEAELRSTYAQPAVTFDCAEPPKRLDATTALELAPHLDWSEFQERLLADSLAAMRQMLTDVGFEGVPTMHNLPISEGATPLDPALIARAVELVGLDYYHGASPPQRAEIARRTSSLAVRSEQMNVPAFACELGAGFPPFFPPLTDHDNAFTALCALAYGLRGFNLYMAVDRDRWIGAPFNIRVERRPSADFWQRLCSALTRLSWHELSRHTPVHIVVPRSFRRTMRVLHAFGPASAAMFQIMGGTAWESCFEDELGLGSAVVLDSERFLRRLEAELETRRIPYAVVAGDLLASSLQQAGWVIVLCDGALEPDLASELHGARRAALSLGPFAPERDHLMRPRTIPLPAAHGDVPALLVNDAAAIERAVGIAQRALSLPCHAASPAEVFVTLHTDGTGRPRVLFVLNPSDHEVRATVDAGAAEYAVDALDEQTFRAKEGQFELVVPKQTVRMLELRSTLV